MKIKKFGFTLAEVLITLTIIGVIASMTIPTLMNNTSEHENKTGLKKMISTLNQAVTMQYALDGTNFIDFRAASPMSTSTEGIFNTEYGLFSAMLMKRMKVMKTTTERKTPKGRGNAAIYLQDGMVIEWPRVKVGTNYGKYEQVNGAISKTCLADRYDPSNIDGCMYTILVDVNGDKGNCKVAEGTKDDVTTNQAGHIARDCFPINVYPDGVRPANYVGRQILYNAED